MDDIKLSKLLSACGLSIRPHNRNLNYLTKNSYLPHEETYENAIEALNKLQSNAATIQQSISNRTRQVDKIKETVKYLNRIGISLNQLDQLSIIHVAGTKGKGSTCSLVESILRSFNIRTGFFSSPHLVSVAERFRIDGVPISQENFTKNFWIVYNRLKTHEEYAGDMPMYFKFLTILCFHIFIEAKVDVAILEVGIGGEKDCTNIVRNTKTVGITSLGLEHTNLLGKTIEEIAWQKAGIIKPNSNVFTVHQPPAALKVIENRVKEKSANLYVVPDFFEYKWNKIPKLQINNEAQLLNASLAIQLSFDWLRSNRSDLNIPNDKNKILCLDVPDKMIEGLEKCYWPGRCQFIDFHNFKVYLDGAHTYESAQICINWFKNATIDNKNPKILIFNLTGDRDALRLLTVINDKIKFKKAYFVPNVPYEKGIRDTGDIEVVKITTVEQMDKCMKNLNVWKNLSELNEGETYKTVENVLQSIDKEFDRKTEIDILVTGSLHLIGSMALALEQFEETSRL